MKLLFDENLSHRLVDLLTDVYPDSSHVRRVGLFGADDARIWDFARSHDFAIASKDSDFRQRSFLEGAPPKVIWLDVGNAGTSEIAGLLRREHARLTAFAADDEPSLLVLPIRENAG